MITIGSGWYGKRRTVRRLKKGAGLCGYLGCGRYATRTAWDRLCNIIDACSDPAHGRSMTS